MVDFSMPIKELCAKEINPNEKTLFGKVNSLFISFWLRSFLDWFTTAKWMSAQRQKKSWYRLWTVIGQCCHFSGPMVFTDISKQRYFIPAFLEVIHGGNANGAKVGRPVNLNKQSNDFFLQLVRKPSCNNYCFHVVLIFQGRSQRGYDSVCGETKTWIYRQLN